MRLSQILALEKSLKNRFNSLMTEFYKLTQKPQLFNGARRTYQPIDDKGTRYPDERQEVQHVVEDHLNEVNNTLIEFFNVTAIRDFGNCEATADVVVDDEKILSDVPATYLLWLDKRLEDMGTLVSSLPILDPAEQWEDRDGGVSRSAEVSTVRMSKEEVPLVLYDATPEHPAQTKSITKDVPVGHWRTTKLSGAIPATQKTTLALRVRKLHDAVKVALQEANSSEVPPRRLGNQVAEFLFPN